MTEVPLQVVVGGRALDDVVQIDAEGMNDALREWAPVTTSRPAASASARTRQGHRGRSRRGHRRTHRPRHARPDSLPLLRPGLPVDTSTFSTEPDSARTAW
ncbi:hypothetical protein [Streptosporangium album]|uniref:hypothetical protein n=1 Tax=Streptosporangium album TaxID=47479 RepID=UPI0035E420BB